MRQRLGQHFLRDAHAVRVIAESAELTAHSRALEIGPGRGVLTAELLPRVQRLTAVELDENLAEFLRQRFSFSERFTLVCQDFLSVDLAALFPEASRQNPIRVLGNLPYSITSPILEKVLAWDGWDTAVFLVQKEVADRMRSAPGSRVYGILSLAVQLFADIEQVLIVRPGAFNPPPKVMSSVIRLRRKTQPAVPLAGREAFFDLLHGAFAHRRKTLANSLAMHSNRKRLDAENWLSAQGIDGGRRAETLGLEEYAKLSIDWPVFRRESPVDLI